MPFEMPAGYSEEEDPLTLEEQKAQSTQNATPTPEPVEEEDDEGDDEPEQLGPFAPVDIDNPVGQFMEDASVAILDAFSDKDADEIREERATQRAITGEKGKAIEERMATDTSIQRELAVAAAGGVEDFAEGVVNLPGDVLSLIPGVDNDFMNATTVNNTIHLMDGGTIHTAANFGHFPRSELVVRKLLKHNLLRNPARLNLAVNYDIFDLRYRFDIVFSPWLNRANKKGIIDNFEPISETEINLDIEKEFIDEFKGLIEFSEIPMEMKID